MLAFASHGDGCSNVVHIRICSPSGVEFGPIVVVLRSERDQRNGVCHHGGWDADYEPYGTADCITNCPTNGNANGSTNCAPDGPADDPADGSGTN